MIVTRCYSKDNGLFQKKIQTVGIEDIKFLEVLKTERVEIPGINQKRSGISKGVQEKLMQNFHGSSFSTLEFLRDVAQFCKISRGESLLFYGISKGKVTNLKTPVFFFRKVHPRLPLFAFFWNGPINQTSLITIYQNLKLYLKQAIFTNTNFEILIQNNLRPKLLIVVSFAQLLLIFQIFLYFVLHHFVVLMIEESKLNSR